ncbi:Anaphase-promoting complex, cyclosome, subunit 3 (plasmid) [Vibrio sp. THAF190c]|nr:Anaphase-promoting complex, cyclosome, subunit 3 [Vibrio sp. THAF190c]
MKKVWMLAGLILMPFVIEAKELSQYTAIRVQKAGQLAQDEKIKEAIEALVSIETERAYDKAYISFRLGSYYWQTDNTSAAIKQLTYAVDSGLLLNDQPWFAQRMLADLLLNEQEFKKALPHYYELVKTVPETEKTDQLWLRIAQVEYRLESWQKILSAIAKYEEFNKAPELLPLSLKFSAQYELKQWKQSIQTLESLITLQPDQAKWWRYLASIQITLDRSRDALNTLALAELQGVEISDSDRRLMAQLYAKRGIPERAAKEISKLSNASSDAQLLAEQATYWQLAREWDQAIEIWTLAAKQKPKYHWNVAQLMVQQGYYSKALIELDKVKEKDKQADVALAKVRSWYKLKDLEKALIHAKKAENLESSKTAQGWIKYLSQLRRVSNNDAV